MKIQLNSISEYIKQDWKKNMLVAIFIIVLVSIYSLIIPTQYMNMISIDVNYSGKHVTDENKKVLEWEFAENIKNTINQTSKHKSLGINATYENYTNIVSLYTKGSNSKNNNFKLKEQCKMIQSKYKDEDISIRLINNQIIQTPKIMQNFIISILIVLTVIILSFLIKYNQKEVN
ncbi:MAG: hypothetical protein E7J25_04225 [Paeniclostridium sordellii]|nr:hypothetical protein [Peptostreptococcaceae bacterium]MDU7966051.1 hypothetical protein [Paeniclostridium sordellii]